MKNVAHDLLGLKTWSDSRPDPSDFTGINCDSLQSFGLVFFAPLWENVRSGAGTYRDYGPYSLVGKSFNGTPPLEARDRDMGNVLQGGGNGAGAGTTRAVQFPRIPEIDVGTFSPCFFAYTLWFKVAGANSGLDETLVSFCNSVTPFTGIAVSYDAGNALAATSNVIAVNYNSGTGTGIGKSVRNLNDGQWHLVCSLASEGTGTTAGQITQYLYVDGLLDAIWSENTAFGPSPQPGPTTSDLYLAGDNQGDPPFAGQMCDVRIYDGRRLGGGNASAWGDALNKSLWNPETRWELYSQPRRLWFFGKPPAGAVSASGIITLGSLAVAASPLFTTSGSGALTLGTLAIASTPLFTAPASGPITLGSLTASGTGAFATASSGAVTLGSLVVAATPGFLTSGSGAVTLAALTASGTGVPQVFGSGTVTLGALSVSSTSVFTTPSSGAITLGTLTVSASPLFTTPATGAITLGSLIVAGTAAPQVFGSGTITLGALSVAATSTFSSVATGSVTLAALTGAGSGISGVFGSGAVTLGAVDGAGSGSFETDATGPITLGSLIVSGTGVAAVSATGAVTLGSVLASGTGSFETDATGNVTLGALSVAASPLFTSVSSGAITLGSLIAAGTGVPEVFGSGTITLGSLSISSTVGFESDASGAVTLGALSGAGFGASGIVGSGAITLGAVVASGSGSFESGASGAITLGALITSGAATFAAAASGAITLGAMAVVGTGVHSASASGTLTLGSLTASGSGSMAVTATGSVALAALGVAGVGRFTTTGSGAVTLAPLLASGSVGGHPFQASGGMRWGGITSFGLPPLLTFRTDYTRQILSIPDGADLRVSWVSLELPGTFFQLYVNGKLMPATKQRFTHIPYPTTSEIFVVGAVPASMASVDFSASLPVVPRHRIELAWIGGRYLGIDIAGFNVYLGGGVGLPVDYSKIVATIPAYSGHQILDGYGEGGYGEGGYGSAATHYQWISDPVATGTWNVAVKSVDILGNESVSALTGSVTVSGPPEPPARDAHLIRLHYTYNAATHEVTLNWLASPSF